MIALDTNILVYAHRREMEWHERARASVEDLLSARRPWALPWSVAHEFLAVVTRLPARPTPLAEALGVLEALAGAPGCRPLAEPAGYLAALRRLAVAGQVSGHRIYDARIAAVCLANGVAELWTADRDFGRFPTLRTRNPLVVDAAP